MQTVMTSNNAYDCILLVDDNDAVVSRWDVDRAVLASYLQDGANADEWETGVWPTGFAPDDQDTEEAQAELKTIAAYGGEVGRNGKIEYAERREFWRVAEFAEN